MAADTPDNPVVAWVVDAARGHSLRARLGDIQPPASYDSPEQVQAGVRTLPKLSADEYRTKVQALPAKAATEASAAK